MNPIEPLTRTRASELQQISRFLIDCLTPDDWLKYSCISSVYRRWFWFWPFLAQTLKAAILF